MSCGTDGIWVTYDYVPPVVTGISPASGPATGGTPVTITGARFTQATYVTFGPPDSTYSLTVNSATSITMVTPPGGGKQDVSGLRPLGMQRR